MYSSIAAKDLKLGWVTLLKCKRFVANPRFSIVSDNDPHTLKKSPPGDISLWIPRLSVGFAVFIDYHASLQKIVADPYAT